MSMVRSPHHLGPTVLAVALGCTSVAALAQMSLNLPPAGLSDSLTALSRAAGVEILADPVMLKGKRADAIQAAPSVESALAQILRGSGLTWQKRGAAYLIVRGSADRRAEDARASTATQADAAIQSTAALSEDGVGVEQAAITVTGSRIGRPELESAMPLTVVQFEEAARFGRLTAIDALQLVPAVSPGLSSASPGGATNKTEYGLDAINLRNLGTNRSLTLIDSQRRVSGAVASSAVNVRMIPTAMIERIEVVTGGAAAIYGADAVTGAVNIITRRDFDGLNIALYQGISQFADAPETNVSLVTGGKTADERLRFIVGATYAKIGSIEFQDRDFSRKRLVYMPNPANTGPSDGVPDNALNRNFLSHILSDAATFFIPNNGMSYAYCNGQLSTIEFTRSFGSTGQLASGEGSTNPCSRNLHATDVLRNADETFNTIAKFDFDLTDNITYAARLEYGRISARSQGTAYREDFRTIFVAPFGGAFAFLDNPFTPDSVRSLLTSFGRDRININRIYSNWPLIYRQEDRDSLTVSQNLYGEIGSSLKWNAFYQWGLATNDITIFNFPLRTQWVAARNVIADPVTGRPVCRDAAARAAGCIPIDIFSLNPLTPEQEAYLLYDRKSRNRTKQEVVGGSLTGSLFALPGGDVSFAVGVEHRAESAERTEDPLALTGEAAHSAAQWQVAQPFDATIKVDEVYGELVVPILRDRPFVHRLGIEGAYRYSSYSTFDPTSTWKIGAFWSPFEGLAVRGVRSRSVRVPNFGELFSPITVSAGGSISDPCLTGNYNVTTTRAANCAALGITTPIPFYNNSLITTSGGNPDLEPETSNSFTVGAVFRPKFIPGLDVTVDYWNIEIANVVTSYSVLQTASLCVDLPTINNDFCPRITRDAQQQIVAATTQLLNAALQRTDGIDLGVNYRVPLGQGQLGFQMNASYLFQRAIQNIQGVDSSIVKFSGGFTDPHFRASLITSYRTGDLGISLLTRFIGAAQFNPNASKEQFEINNVPSRLYNDISVSKNIDDLIELTIGVRNMFNVEPARLPDTYVGANGQYDTIGRFFFVSARKNF